MPTLPLTYPDVICSLDVDPFARETSSDLENLEQDCLHVLLQDRGSNLDDPDRGVGIEQLLSGTSLTLPQVAKRIDQELVKDDRITSSTTSIVQEPDGSFTLTITIVVGAATLGLQFSFSAAKGLQVMS